jgi:hypothetical protein
MPFEPHTIPLNSGLRQDQDNAAVGNASYLSIASNLIVNHKESLRGRPGMVSQDALVQNTNTFGAVTQTNLLSQSISGLLPAGISAVDQQLLALWQGQGFVRSDPTINKNIWRNTGSVWSTKLFSSPLLTYTPIDPLALLGAAVSPVAVGSQLVSTKVTSNTSTGLAITSNNKLDIFDTQALTNYDNISAFNACIVNVNTGSGFLDVIVYPKTDGSLWYHVVGAPSAPGAGTEVNILAAASVAVSSTIGQAVWVTTSGSVNEVFIAYKSTTAGSIGVTRLLLGSGITATLTLSGLGTIKRGVSLCHNQLVTGSGGRLCLGFDNQTNYITKILNCASTSVITDAALDATHGATGSLTGSALGHTVSNNPITSGIIVCYNRLRFNSMFIEIRLYTTTATTVNYTLFASVPGAFNSGAVQYTPFTTATSISGKILIGVYRQIFRITGGVTLAENDQWIILDITNAIQSSGPVIVVAAGQPESCKFAYPINIVKLDALTLKFGVTDGVSFNVNGIQSWGVTVKTLSFVAAKTVFANGIGLISGYTPYIYDGLSTVPSGFIEQAPVIVDFSTAVGGASSAGSYTVQATWEIQSGKGQIIRSDASNIVTINSVAVSSQLSISVSVPQLISRYLVTGYNIVCKLYITKVNPAANAPLYLTSTQTVPITNGIVTSGIFTFTGILVSADTDSSQEQLYTGGNVFGDQLPGGADRGIAFCNQRLWTADSRRVYVSKLLRSQTIPAWNRGGGLVLEMPTSIGEIQALGTIIDKLIVIGNYGFAIIFGAGIDDQGNGPGWTIDIISGTKSSLLTTPRTCIDIPGVGVGFIGIDNEVYLIAPNGSSQCISRYTKDTINGTITDLCYIDSYSNGSSIELGPMLITNGEPYKLFDVESKSWFTWETLSTTSVVGFCNYFTTLNGIIYAQTGSNTPVIAFTDWNSGADLFASLGAGGNITQSIGLVNCSISGPQDGQVTTIWGRLRSINIVGLSPFSGYTQTVSATADNSGLTLLNKSSVISFVSTGNWPWTNIEEYRATIQRCGSFKVSVTAKPALAEWANIEYWSTATGDRAPSRNRR